MKDMRQSIRFAVALLMMGFCVQTASAQAKKRPAAKKPVTTAKKPVATKVNNNFAILEFDEWINDDNPFEDEENIYFLGNDSPEKNTLRAVNKQTGDVRIVVPKKKRARPMICSAGCDGKNIYMRLEDKGIARFNGTDVNTSEIVLPQSEQFKGFLIRGNRGKNITCSPNGRYIILYGDTPLVYDLLEKRVVRTGVNNTAQAAALTDDGLLISLGYSTILTAPKHDNPTIDFSSPKNRVGVKEVKTSDIDNGADGDFCSMWYDVPANMIYVAVGEQVLKSPAQADLSFQEVYCLPGENKKFSKVAFNDQRVFAITDNYEKHFYEWDNKDMTGTPKISKELETGINYKTKYAWGDPTPYKLSSVNRLFYDSMGNLWLQSGDGLFVIYNPDGIKGLTSLKGKWTKNDLPKEED